MTTWDLLAAIVGAGIAGGIVLFAAGMVGTTKPPRTPASRKTRRLRSAILPGATSSDDDSGVGWRLLPVIAVAVGLVAWLITGWPAVGLIVAGAVIGLPHVMRALTGQTRMIAQLDALQEWTRRLANVLDAGRGLDTALKESVTGCPEQIAPAVRRTTNRLNAGVSTEDAVRGLADDLNSPVGDTVAAALILASQLRGEGTGRVLEALADTVAKDVANRRETEADRASPRTSAKAVVAILTGTCVYLSFATDFLEPFSTVSGQIVLVLLAGCGALSVLWLVQMANPEPDPRFLVDARGPGGDA